MDSNDSLSFWWLDVMVGSSVLNVSSFHSPILANAKKLNPFITWFQPFFLMFIWEVLDTSWCLRDGGNPEGQNPDSYKMNTCRAFTEWPPVLWTLHMFINTCIFMINTLFCWLQQSYAHVTVEETGTQFSGVPKNTVIQGQSWGLNLRRWLILTITFSGLFKCYHLSSWTAVDFISLS